MQFRCANAPDLANHGSCLYPKMHVWKIWACALVGLPAKPIAKSPVSTLSASKKFRYIGECP